MCTRGRIWGKTAVPVRRPIFINQSTPGSRDWLLLLEEKRDEKLKMIMLTPWFTDKHEVMKWKENLSESAVCFLILQVTLYPGRAAQLHSCSRLTLSYISYLSHCFSFTMAAHLLWLSLLLPNLLVRGVARFNDLWMNTSLNQRIYHLKKLLISTQYISIVSSWASLLFLL